MSAVKENWRDSEVQAISPDRWTRLNGTDVEILLPEVKTATLIRVRRASADVAPAGIYSGDVPSALVTEPGLYSIGFEVESPGKLKVTRVEKVSG